jgi:amino acid transporter
LSDQNAPSHVATDSPTADTKLVRGLGLPQSIALNISNMVGIGPFVTIPLFIAAMNGPQALIAWVIAAVLVICDGLVWSELGAALPGSGGTYHFLREIFGRHRSPWARLLPFLFVWQFLVSGTLEVASGYIGAMPYVEFVWPQMTETLKQWHIPGGASTVAAFCCVMVTWLLSRRIDIVGQMGLILCVGTIITVATVIVSGLIHFNSDLITLPPDAFRINGQWVHGLGGAMLIAIYDYLGYYNICHLGDEVRDPGRTIPRAVITSVIVVASIYLTMNLSIIAVVPWEEAMKSTQIASLFMETLYGHRVAVWFTGLILWTVLACMFAITLGYSRIPFAAAVNGDFLPQFAKVHPTRRYPVVSLWTLGALTAVFCYLPLQTVIEAAVVVRILVQFIAQILALHVLRTTRPDVPMPFRMWFYPIPSLIALAGWLFVLGTVRWELWGGMAVVIVSGTIVYFLFVRKPVEDVGVPKI